MMMMEKGENKTGNRKGMKNNKNLMQIWRKADPVTQSTCNCLGKENVPRNNDDDEDDDRS